MPYLNQEALAALGLQHCGADVRISDRAAIYNPELISVGDNVRIDDFCVVSGRITFEGNNHIAVFCNINGGTAGVSFEQFSGLAYGCHVFALSDDYTGRTMVGPITPERFKSINHAAVRLRRHSMVGTGSIVLPGVTLEEGTAVGAMSLVTDSTAPWGIYAGIPAKRLRDREQGIVALERQYLAELAAQSSPSTR